MNPRWRGGALRQATGLLIAVALLLAPLLSRADLALAGTATGPLFILCASSPDGAHDAPSGLHDGCRLTCSMACHAPVLPPSLGLGTPCRLSHHVRLGTHVANASPVVTLFVLRIRGPPAVSLV